MTTEDDAWAQAQVAALQTELTPGRAFALIAALADDEELQILAYGRGNVEHYLGAPIEDDQWRRVRATTKWRRIMNVADHAVFREHVIREALNEAGL